MKNLLLIFIASFALITLSANTAHAQKASPWTKLGDRKVNFRADHDEIPVTVLKGTYRRLKLRVRKAPIYIHNIRIVYGNGKSTNIKVKKRIAAGSESRAFDLPGRNRVIKKIVFNYKSVPTFKGRGYIAVWGRH